MATQDPKDVSKKPGAPENVEPQELTEDDLKAVSGGISSTGGSALSGAAVCVSTD